MLRLVLVSSFVAFAAACPSSTAPSATTTPAPADNPLCPMIAGTSIAAEDTATGGALVFASTGDRAALRDRVGGWAARHNARHAAMGPLPGDPPTAGATGGGDGAMADGDGAMAHHHHHHGGGDSGGGGGAMTMGGDPAEWIAAHSRAEVADTDDGVRITFVTFPDQLAALQGELHMHAEHLGASGCGAR